MKIIILVFLIVTFFSLFGTTFDFEFSDFVTAQKGNYQILSIENTYFNRIPGKPLLPVKPVYLIVPFGMKVGKISASEKNKILSQTANLFPFQPELPTNQDIKQDFYVSETYKSNNLYPEKSFKKIDVQRKNGVDILVLQLFPIQYNPIGQQIVFHRKITLDIIFEPDARIAAEQKRKLLNNRNLRQIFTGNSYANRNALVTYENKSEKYKTSRTSLVSSDEPYDYIIITNSTLQTEWNDLISQKENFGLNVNLYTTADIFADYSGDDNADKIRNFIIDAYETWSGTEHPLMWVLLGGDSDAVTSRSVRCYAYWSSNWNTRTYYTDLYFAGLDGDWDNDGDRIYGEGDDSQRPDDFPSSYILGTNGEEADFFPDVYLGRVFLSDAAEISNWLNKTISYENLTLSNDYLRTITLVGQYLGYGAYGGTAQDEIALFYPDFDQNRFYQMNGTYSKNNVVSAINNGTNIVSHLGHSSSSHVFDMYDGDVDTLLTNTDYCLITTQGCYTCLFYGIHCIGESFLEKEHGAFAFVGNTHYGFYSSYKDQGSSQLFEREMMDAIFNERKTNLGMALADSKSDLAALIGAVGSLRWVGLDNSFFGDPHLSLHLDVGNVTAAQTTDDKITVTFEDALGSGIDDYNNYTVYERDDDTSEIPVSSCSVNGDQVILSLNEILTPGIPYNLKIENVSGILNPTVRAVNVLSNIVEMSIITPTTWTKSDGPYYLYEDLIIRSNLTVEPGTVLKFNGGKGIVVLEGWLKAVGTEEDTIKFVPYENDRYENGSWADITFYRDADHDECEMEYCLFEYSTNGVYFDSLSTASIKHSIIVHTSENGIYSYYANPVIENVVVAFAEGDTLDNGFYFEGSNPQIKNIDGYENDNYGIYAVNSQIDLINSIIYGNVAGSVFNDSSIVDISYSDVEGSYSGMGNIDSDTLFTNPTEYDFSLAENSPCIDTGDPIFARDPDGTRADMGAFYYSHIFNFTADKKFGYDSLAVTFTDLSDCETTSWSWDFQNDGIYDSFVETPTFTFTEPGIFDVKMKIERSGWADSLIKENYIVIQESQLPPPVDFSITINGNNAILEWSAIDTTAMFLPRENLYYLIYESDSPYEDFIYLENTQDTIYSIDLVANEYEKRFYFVIGFMGNLESLKMYVSANHKLSLNKKQGISEKNALFNLVPRRGIEPLLQE